MIGTILSPGYLVSGYVPVAVAFPVFVCELKGPMARHVFQKPSLHMKGQNYTEREYGDRHSVRMCATQRSRLHMQRYGLHMHTRMRAYA